MSAQDNVRKNWWMFLIRGIVATLFGLITIINPTTTAVFIVLTFGLFLLVSGITEVIYSISSLSQNKFWPVHLILGVIEAGFGVYLVQRPELTALVLVTFIALSLMFRGVLEIAAAFEPNLDGGLRVLNIVVGVLTILGGIIIWRYPVAGGFAYVWVLGLFALISGPIWIAYAIRARDGDGELAHA